MLRWLEQGKVGVRTSQFSSQLSLCDPVPVTSPLCGAVPPVSALGIVIVAHLPGELWAVTNHRVFIESKARRDHCVPLA